MKIAYYTDCSLDNHDGPAINEQEFLFQLKRKYNNDFLFITPYKNKKFCEKNNVECVYFFEEMKFSSIRQKIDYFKFARKLSKQDFDIMVCRLTDIPFIPFFTVLLNKSKKLAIKTAAAWNTDDIKTKTFFDRIFIKIRDFIYRYMYRRADVIDTALPYAEAYFVNMLNIDKNKIFHVENGINTKKFSLTMHDSMKDPLLEEIKRCWPILGFMGSLPSLRGVRQILEVSKRIMNEYPRLGVLILGHDAQLDSMVDFLTRLGVRVFALGKVPYSNIEQYTKLMTIGFSFYEESAVEICGNASQKVRQYLACGKPVFSIYHNHQFISDHDLGAIFKSDDYDAMAGETIKWVKRIEQDGEEISNRLSTYAAHHFSVESTFNQRLKIYQDILKKYEK